jgi:hypothetical protein
MKSITIRIIFGATVTLLAFAAYAYRGRSIVTAQQREPVMATRLFTGADGLSHAERISVKLSAIPGGPDTIEQSEPVKVTSSYVVRLAPGFFESWHNADKRRYVIPISGLAEIEIAGGEKIYAEPGQIFLAEDLTGKGHTFRVLGTNDWVALFVQFAE